RCTRPLLVNVTGSDLRERSSIFAQETNQKHITDINLKSWGFPCTGSIPAQGLVNCCCDVNPRIICTYIEFGLPDFVPPIPNPRAFLIVAEVHKDEVDSSAATHLSSTHRSGTTKISTKYYWGSSESLEVDGPLAKVLMVESPTVVKEVRPPLSTLESNSESQTLQQMSAQAGTSSTNLPSVELSSGRSPIIMSRPTVRAPSFCSADSLLDFEWRVTDDLRGSDHYPILLSSSEVLPTPQEIWDLFKELAKVGQCIEYLATLLRRAGHCSIPQTSGLLRANDGNSFAAPQEVAEVFATAFAGGGGSSMEARS
ncbi:hypothetical protein Hamer_G006512, partial [Homarus americanus]